MSDLSMSSDEYERIKSEIESSDSPVGIDAQKAHVIIIQKLLEIERRLAMVEDRIAAISTSRSDAPDGDVHA